VNRTGENYFALRQEYRKGVKNLAGSTFSFVRNLTIMSCATAGRHAVIHYKVIRIPPLTTNKLILFYEGISAHKKKVRFIFELTPYSELNQLYWKNSCDLCM